MAELRTAAMSLRWLIVVTVFAVMVSGLAAESPWTVPTPEPQQKQRDKRDDFSDWGSLARMMIGGAALLFGSAFVKFKKKAPDRPATEAWLEERSAELSQAEYDPLGGLSLDSTEQPPQAPDSR